jgi:hypothetical protein
MVMTSPQVRLYADGTHSLDNAATMFKTDSMPIGVEQRPAWYMPATFQVYGLSTPASGEFPFTFTIDRVVSVWESGPARLMVDVVDVHIGALHDEAIWAKAEKVARFQRTEAPWRITSATLRAIPIDTFVDEALKLAQVIVNVTPLVRPLDPELWIYRVSDGSGKAMNAWPIEYQPQTTRNTRDLRGKKSRGARPNDVNAPKWNDKAMLVFAAKCYTEGLTHDETARAFEGQRPPRYFSPNTVKQMWAEGTKQGLMKRNRRTTK